MVAMVMMVMVVMVTMVVVGGEMSSIDSVFEHLVPGRWHCLERARLCSLNTSP